MNTETAIHASMTTISSDGTTTHLHDKVEAQKQVDVRINYPKDYNGDKFYREGAIEKGMAADSAEILVKAGIATVITEEAAEEGAPATKPYNKMNKAELLSEIASRSIEADESLTKAELVALLEDSDEEE